jgi:hypothetical protein
MVCREARSTLESLIKARNKIDELRKENPSKPQENYSRRPQYPTKNRSEYDKAVGIMKTRA